MASTTQQQLASLAQRAAQKGLLVSDVEKEKQSILQSEAVQQQVQQQQTPVVDSRTQELSSRKERLQSEAESLKALNERQTSQALSRIKVMRGQLADVLAGKLDPRSLNLGKNPIGKLRKRIEGQARFIENVTERMNSNLLRINNDLLAIDNALSKGTSLSFEEKKIRRKQASKDRAELARESSELEQANIKVSLGLETTERERLLLNKDRLRRRGEFSTRVIPKFSGETIGKKSGVFISPITGKPVIVREGGATSLPPSARAEFSVRAAPSIFERPITLFATVKGEERSKVVSPLAEVKVPEKRLSASGVVLPVGEVGTNISVQPAGTQQNLAEAFGLQPQTFEEAPKPLLKEEKAPSLFVASSEEVVPEESTRIGPFVITSQGAEGLITAGSRDIAKGKFLLQSGEVLEGSQLVGKGLFEKFAGGVRRSLTGIKEDPALAAASAGAFVLAGPSGAVPLFAAQNVFEFKTGREPTVVRAAREPVAFTGELAPFVAVAGAGSLGSSAVRSARATKLAEGKVLTKDLSTEVLSQTKDLSTEFRVEPILGVRQDVVTAESFGVQRGKGVQTAQVGEPVFLTAKEVSRLPNTFIFDADISQLTGTRLLSGRPKAKEGFFFDETSSVSAPAQTSFVSGTARGRVTAEGLQEALTPVSRVDVRASDVSPGTLRQTRSSADIRFTPFDPPATSELVVTGSPKKGPVRAGEVLGIEKKGGQVGFEPKLDFFEEFTLESKGSSITIRESPFTGERQVFVTPFVVSRVAARPGVKKAGEGVVGSASTSGVVDVAVGGPGGLVQLQKVKVDSFTPSQTQTTKTETKKDTKQKSKQKVKSLQEQRQEAASKQTRGFEQQVFVTPKGTTISEAIVKFKPLRTASLQEQLKLSNILSAQKTSLAQLQARSQLQAQASKSAQAQALSLAQAQAQLQAQASQSAQAQAQALTSLLAPVTVVESVSRGRSVSQPIDVLTPLVPPVGEPKPERKREKGVELQVRRFGKFRTVARGLSPLEADLRGKTILASTAAASFRVVGDGAVSNNFFGSQFRRSKIDPNIVVEKVQYRISSPGEVAEISRKGQQSRRGSSSDKKKRGKKKGFFWRRFQMGIMDRFVQKFSDRRAVKLAHAEERLQMELASRPARLKALQAERAALVARKKERLFKEETARLRKEEFSAKIKPLTNFAEGLASLAPSVSEPTKVSGKGIKPKSLKGKKNKVVGVKPEQVSNDLFAVPTRDQLFGKEK